MSYEGWGARKGGRRAHPHYKPRPAPPEPCPSRRELEAEARLARGRLARAILRLPVLPHVDPSIASHESAHCVIAISLKGTVHEATALGGTELGVKSEQGG